MSRAVLVVFSFAMLSCLLYAETGRASSLRFPGNAGRLDGRVSIRVDPQTPADIGSTHFTIDFWMQASRTGNNSGSADGVCDRAGYDWINGNIILDRDRLSPGPTRDFGVSLVSGRIAFGVEPTGGNQYTICSASGAAADLRDGNWHHIALQRNSSSGELSVYVDGVLHRQAIGPVGDLSYPNGETGRDELEPFLVLGAEKYGFANDYVGLIDELRLSTVLRYSANFTRPSAPYTLDGSTAALYHFDEQSGDVIVDENGDRSPGVRCCSNSVEPEWVADTPFTATPSPGQISFTSATYSADESGGVAAVVVQRTGGSSGQASATVSVTGGTATGGADYQVAAPVTVSWQAGDPADKTVQITILDDSDVEPAETVSLNLSDPTGAALGSPTAATLTINDNDSPASPGTIQFSGATASVNEGQASIVLTLSRTGGSAGSVAVSYATSNGTAVAGSDYTASSGTVTWDDGVAASQTITIPILNDSVVESAESFTVTLSNVQGGASLGAAASATVTINDEDAPAPPGNSGGGGGGGGGSTDWGLLAGLLALWLGSAPRPRRAGISRRRM